MISTRPNRAGKKLACEGRKAKKKLKKGKKNGVGLTFFEDFFLLFP